jgi:hypothetical protein
MASKNRKVWFWCIFLSPLELTLAKNHDLEKWRACGAAPKTNSLGRGGKEKG